MSETGYIINGQYLRRKEYILRIGAAAFRWKSCARFSVKALKWKMQKGYESSHLEGSAQFWQAYAKEVEK